MITPTCYNAVTGRDSNIRVRKKAESHRLFKLVKITQHCFNIFINTTDYSNNI